MSLSPKPFLKLHSAQRTSAASSPGLENLSTKSAICIWVTWMRSFKTSFENFGSKNYNNIESK